MTHTEEQLQQILEAYGVQYAPMGTTWPTINELLAQILAAIQNQQPISTPPYNLYSNFTKQLCDSAAITTEGLYDTKDARIVMELIDVVTGTYNGALGTDGTKRFIGITSDSIPDALASMGWISEEFDPVAGVMVKVIDPISLIWILITFVKQMRENLTYNNSQIRVINEFLGITSGSVSTST